MQEFFLVFRVRPSWQVNCFVSSFPSNGLWTASKGHVTKKSQWQWAANSCVEEMRPVNWENLKNMALYCGISEPVTGTQYQELEKRLSRRYRLMNRNVSGKPWEKPVVLHAQPLGSSLGVSASNSQTIPLLQTHTSRQPFTVWQRR